MIPYRARYRYRAIYLKAIFSSPTTRDGNWMRWDEVKKFIGGVVIVDRQYNSVCETQRNAPLGPLQLGAIVFNENIAPEEGGGRMVRRILV